MEDLAAYQSTFKPPVTVHLSNGDYTLYNPPAPSSGVVMSFITGILDGRLFAPDQVEFDQKPYAVSL
jgi:gamma-glutamyltranspeptidase